MAALYLMRPGESDESQARRDAEQALLADVRARVISRTAGDLAITATTVRRVVGAIFDHVDSSEKPCTCHCHPRFATTHDGGFDCPCTWSDERREHEREELFGGGSWQEEMREAADRERQEIDEWLAGASGVTAERTCTAAPEVWEGEIDSLTFFFRERHGEWRIEVDLEPDGTFAERVTGMTPDGEFITEPVELTSGRVIAHGLEDDLGGTAVEHLAFIVRVVRAHLRVESCAHDVARSYCADCGRRMDDR